MTMKKALLPLVALLFVSVATDSIAHETVYYLHNDHLGTPQMMTDQAGRVVWKAEYEPFGKAVVDEDPDGDGMPVENNLRFPGQYYDAETGLHHNYHRDYDPGTGRYLEADPAGIQDGTNHLYAYAQGNPISNSDPLGLIVYSCAGRIRTYPHAYICLQDSDGFHCAGLMPTGGLQCQEGGIILPENYHAQHCSPVSLPSGKCCGLKKYEDCIRSYVVDSVGDCWMYGAGYRCFQWRNEVLRKCQEVACEQ